MYSIYMPRAAKHWCKKSMIQINGDVSHVHGLTFHIDDVSSSQLNLKIQCKPNWNPRKPLYRHERTDSKVYVERQKT